MDIIVSDPRNSNKPTQLRDLQLPLAVPESEPGNYPVQQVVIHEAC